MLDLSFLGSATSGMQKGFSDPVSPSVINGKEFLSQRIAVHTVPVQHPEDYGSRNKFLKGNQGLKRLNAIPHFTKQTQNQESK